MMKEIAKKQRASNFELLRILAMLGVVVAHLIGYSPEVAIMFEGASKQTLYLSILSCAGKIGLHVFVMISGYFLVKSTFKWDRIFKVWKATWIWSVLLLIVTIFVGHRMLTGQDVLTAIFPVLRAEYWFVPTYIIIVLISPVINRLLLDKNQEFLFKLLVAICAVFYGLNLLGDIYGFRLDLIQDYRLLSYLLTFAVGGYLRLHPPKLTMQKRLLLLLLAVGGLVLWRMVRIYIMRKTGVELWAVYDQDLFVFLMAVAIFVVFMGWNLKYNKIINYMGGATFAVYLITENPFMRPVFWNHINIYSTFGTMWVYLFPIFWGVVVTVGCIMVEMARAKLGKTICEILRLEKLTLKQRN